MKKGAQLCCAPFSISTAWSVLADESQLVLKLDKLRDAFYIKKP